MKIIFIANTVNFHMTGLFDEFTAQHPEVTFIYLSTSKMDEERTHMGYKDLTRSYAKYSLDMSEEELKKMFSTTDIALYGLSDDPRVHKYIRLSKDVVVISEHIKRSNPFRNVISILNHFYRKKRFLLKGKKYLLAMSSYASDEYSPFGFKGRCYRFGYFPELPICKETDRDNFSLLYCGRLLKLKHVEHSIYALNYLKKIDERYHLDIVGEGEAKPYLEKLVDKLNLKDSVKFHNFENHDLIVERYSKCQISFFSSDKKEGWGVVLNEMLSQKAIVFANTKAGSTRFLANENNAFLYSNKKTLLKALEKFTECSPEQLEEIRENASQTIQKEWNNKEAAKRLFELFESITSGKKFDKYTSGPVSLFKK